MLAASAGFQTSRGFRLLVMSPQPKSHRKALEATLLAFAVLIGFIRVWAARNTINPDGISYLDVGDAYLGGHWTGAISDHWSPLYPWLLGASLKILKPPAAWEFPAAHFTTFVIYLVALLCFRLFWAALIRHHVGRLGEYQKMEIVALPEPVWIALGYLVFTVSSVEFVNLEYVGADMCVAAIVYLISAVLLRLHTSPTAPRKYLLLGVLLGFGYLAKAVMLPLSVVFILAALPVRAGFRKILLSAAATAVGLALIASPYVWALSKHQGHLTYSESGNLQYAWTVNNLPFWWAGESSGFGTPIHPRTKIFDQPLVYTFEGPLRGTYPGWYDPTYWLAGIKSHFNLRQQLVRLKLNSQIIFGFFFGVFQIALVAGVLIWYLFGAGRFPWFAGLRDYWYLVLPPLAAAAVYWPLWVEPRYIAPFLGLFWAGIFSGVRMPDSPESRRLVSCMPAAVVPLTLAVVLASTVGAVDQIGTAPPTQFQVAEYLHRIGIRPGDRVGAIGRVMECGWARLARVQITTEINHGSDAAFRASSVPVRSAAIAAMFSTGVRAIISDSREDSGCPSGWRSAAGTGFSVCTPR